ncbi:MAG: AAC(3)-I family aminoglycoside N-acetyltransferase [Cognatishimia sp.]|uniref:AAC(3)-I family aminoglycoside N-acetyltransferase n=1 Tax=Cognatishimia sp. TaxID=2211648 RepID=UPI0040590E19
MTEKFSIVRLGGEDLGKMRALNQLFGRCFEDPDTYVCEQPSDTYLRDWLAQPTVIALVARREGQVIGGLVAYVLQKFERARSEIYIYDLAVCPETRRQGVATSLIERVSDIARQTGAWVTFVQADYEDAPAVALYEKLGLREEVLHFDIPPKGKSSR